MASKGRPAAHVVLLDGAWGAVTEGPSIELTSNKDDLATILHDLGSGLTSYLSGANADRVVVRRADQAKVASNREGPRLRLLAEGALVGAARSQVNDVLVLSGKELADRCRAASKADLDSAAASQAPGSAKEAAAAALSGLDQ